MRALEIGSSAARYRIPTWREPKDIDYWCDEDLPSGVKSLIRFDTFWHPRLADLLEDNVVRTATLDELYTIKFSHAYWELRNGSWEKHMADLLSMRDHGAQLIPEWHDHLYRVWEDVHGKKVVDLTQEAEEFFTDAVKRIYVHDSIHDSVAYHDRPIYEECLKDGKSVQMDMEKVWAMPFERQVQMFREEIYVTALERLVIPSDYKCSPGRAYRWALRRTITSLTKGRSAKFLVENFDIFARADVDYVGIHLANTDKLVRL
ncbi:hypothetical protein BJD55_gp016 [Gordonia phage Yvonnetastic]|uniref:Uncharacterized protein n=1 Tax=Gordonia phage Yvonnetastic TaxID=1821566 RepID=A0A142K8Y2_9CAUD|nr:hypothetical protein BJD55_gp016 [Gordonia phage Yvonnetastic]AMS02565.1 hypothetical protein SEA_YVONNETASTIC_16 [Gordonia phage Yvonnetastic]